MSDPSISAQHAYQAMIAFLEGHYARTGSADIAGLLGDMAQRRDGTTADAAIWTDWMDCVARVSAHGDRVKQNGTPT